MTTHFPFPHIESLREALMKLKFIHQNPVQTGEGWSFDESLPLPTIKFKGSVKLHGTNTAIIFATGKMGVYFQSRERVLSHGDDQNGFWTTLSKIPYSTLINALPVQLREEWDQTLAPIKVYGEWCGKGVMKAADTAVAQLDKLFVAFAIQVGNRWCSWEDVALFSLPQFRIFNIYQFAKPFDVEINFNDLRNPESEAAVKVVNDLTSRTLQIEEECPFSKGLGAVGTGEGIVWHSDVLDADGNPLMFKTKGAKHKNIKEKQIVQLTPDQASSLTELISNVVTEQRLEQGFARLGENPSKKQTPEFMKWVENDIKRENADTLAASGLDMKDITSAIQKASREWFLGKV